MFCSIIFLPLAGTLLASLSGRTIGPTGASVLTCFFLALASFCSFFVSCFFLLPGTIVSIHLFTWIISGNFEVVWTLLFDNLTCVMINVVCFISFLVHVYGSEYMSHDPHLPRFMSYLSFFTFFMLVLVTSDNFLQLFVGWEGVGLCSFLLINFWFTRIQANKAAIKAMLLNRVGDIALALALFVIYQIFGSLTFGVVFSLTPYLTGLEVNFFLFSWDVISLICLLLFIGCMGKSAQFGLHVWLPDAMEGPTPVSALIHAATMVTAGVFLITRCSILFEHAPDIRAIVAFVGVLTSFFAATTGLLQNDLKRVIAYSTASQLGYMVFSCGLSNYAAGFFHLSNHAFFKALLFLSAGSIIHSTLDEQDMRKLGGLRRILPFAYSAVVVGSFSLFGVPFLTGFYSKDAILELSLANSKPLGLFCFIFGSIGAFFTAFYSLRLIYLVFLTEANGSRIIYLKAHEAPLRIAFPLVFLILPSVLVGFLSKDMFLGLGTNCWNGCILVLPENQFLSDSEFIPFALKQVPLFLATLGAVASFLLYRFYPILLVLIKMSSLGRVLYTFLNRKWFIDRLYTTFVSLPLMDFSYLISYKMIDKGLIEITGPRVSNQLAVSSSVVNQLSPALLYSSIFLIFFGFLAMILIQLFCFYKKIIFVQIAFLCTVILFLLAGR